MAKRRTAETAKAFRSEFEDTKRELEPILASIEEAIASGGADARKVIEDKGRAFMALASELIDSAASDAASVAGNAAARTVEATGDAAENGIANLEECIRSRPLTSVSIAFVSGWVLSRFMAHR